MNFHDHFWTNWIVLNNKLFHLSPLKHVGRVEVAVVVDIDIHHALGVGAYPRQGLDDHPLVLETGTARLQDVEENLLQKHLNEQNKETLLIKNLL